jgi:hypothetical protein
MEGESGREGEEEGIEKKRGREGGRERSDKIQYLLLRFPSEHYSLPSR